MEPLYEDNHLLALYKPKGWLTQPAGEAISLENEAKAWIKSRDKKPGNVFLHALFRLDRPVSGIVLFAKSQKALSRLNQAMRERQFKKMYRALVEGSVDKEGTLEHFLIHDAYKAKVDPEGKRAVLHYKKLKEMEGNSFVEIELETGRYHQIRAQFAAIGHPIVGDQKYGAKNGGDKHAIELEHVQLEFTHPVTRERMTLAVE